MKTRIFAVIVTTALLILAMAGSATCLPTDMPDRAASPAEQKTIDAIQKAIDEKGMNWTAGVTSISDLTADEKSNFCGAKPEKAEERQEPDKIDENVVLGIHPDTWDWRDVDGQDWMTTPKSQGGCGSCWAFSAIGVVEAVANIRSGNPDLDYDLSEQHLVSDCYAYGDCAGGWPSKAFEYMGWVGVPDEACFPYMAADSQCTPCEDWENRTLRISSSISLRDTEYYYKEAIIEYGPISGTIISPDDWFYYTGGVYEPTGVGGTTGKLHAIVIVGWNDTEECWIIKNSAGPGWGEGGYGKVLYGIIEDQGDAYAVGGIEHYPPVAEAAASPESGSAPLTVAFTGTGFDPDGTITAYAWTFGDGESSEEQNPIHEYEIMGIYTATLTVTDNDGLLGCDTVTIINGDWESPVSATASSYFDYTCMPEKAVDGLQETAWLSSINDQNCWIAADYDEGVPLYALYLSMCMWDDYALFDVDVSFDSNTWYTVAENVQVSEPCPFEVVINTPPIRYVKLRLENVGPVEGCCEIGSILLPNHCKGDFCGATGGSSPPDGYIGQFDAVAFGMAYGSTLGDPNYNVVGDFCGATGGSSPPDGYIGQFDAVAFGMVYGTYCAQ